MDGERPSKRPRHSSCPPASAAPSASRSRAAARAAPIPPAPLAGRRGRSRTPTSAQSRDPASYISDADFAAMREGRPFEAHSGAPSSTMPAQQSQPVTRKAPPVPVVRQPRRHSLILWGPTTSGSTKRKRRLCLPRWLSKVDLSQHRFRQDRSCSMTGSDSSPTAT